MNRFPAEQSAGIFCLNPFSQGAEEILVSTAAEKGNFDLACIIGRDVIKYISYSQKKS